MVHCFQGITIHSPKVIENIKKKNYPSEEVGGVVTVQSPDGYKFHICDKQTEGGMKFVVYFFFC